MMDRFEMAEFLIDNLGVERTLGELVNALSDDEMKELFDYIVRMYDLEVSE